MHRTSWPFNPHLLDRIGVIQLGPEMPQLQTGIAESRLHHGDTNWASPFQVVLRKVEKSQPVKHLDGMAAGTVVIAHVGFDDRFTDGR